MYSGKIAVPPGGGGIGIHLRNRSVRIVHIQGVSETGALILTSNRTHQKEQLFCLPFWRKTLRSGLKK
jgi:hypothetical protein